VACVLPEGGRPQSPVLHTDVSVHGAWADHSGSREESPALVLPAAGTAYGVWAEAGRCSTSFTLQHKERVCA